MESAFLEHLLAHESFLIVSHIRPDGDAVGSQLAMARFLEKLGKSAIVAGIDPLPASLDWMTSRSPYELFAGETDQILRFSSTDAVLIVDTNAAQRLGALRPIVTSHRGPAYLIDHHPNPETWFAESLLDTSASSTGELVFRLIEAEDKDTLDEQIAEALYVAIVTDTGGFRFNSVTADVHRIVADLIECGHIDPEEMYARIYQSRTLEGQLLLSLALDTIQLDYGGRLGYMLVTRDMLQRSGATSDEAEGFTDHILAIEGVRVALLFLEVGEHVKVSFRSKGNVHVNEWAAAAGGGGHPNAAGAFVRSRLQPTLRRVLQSAGKYIR